MTARRACCVVAAFVALLLGAGLLAGALAHEGGADFRGVVTSAEGGQLTVRGVQGKEHRAALTLPHASSWPGRRRGWRI